MLSRLLIAGLALELSLYGMLWWLIDLPTAYRLLLVVAIAVGWRTVFRHGLFLVANHVNGRRTPWRVMLRETFSFAYLFTWAQPLAPWLWRDRPGTDGAALLFVHGFFCNRGFWRTQATRLHHRYGASVYGLDLEPLFGSLDRLVPLLDAKINALLESGHKHVVIVAHSMGGVVSRQWLANTKIQRTRITLITVASPHRGTVFARALPFTNTRQLRPGSDWLERLNRDTGGAPDYCVWTRYDEIILPASHACLPPTPCHEFPDEGHMSFARSIEFTDWLARTIGLSKGSK